MDQRSHGQHRDHYYQHRGSNGPPHTNVPPKRNYKLIIDPFIVKGAAKTYRFEGLMEDDPSYPIVTVRDPRKIKIWIRSENIDIPVPRFKIDSNYMGEPPPIEVTIFNVNDNIDHQFLHNEIVNKHQCGPLEDLQIFTHDLSRKHLGIARIIFEETECSRMCVRKMNGTTLMGKILKVFLDPFGKQCDLKVKEIINNLEDEAKKEEEAKEARKRPAPPPVTVPPPVKEKRKDHHEQEKLNHRYQEEQKNQIYTQSYYGDQSQSHINSYPQSSTSGTSSPAPPYSYPPPVHLSSHQNTPQYNYPYQEFRPGYQAPTALSSNHQWQTNSHSNNLPQHHSSPWSTSNQPSTPVIPEFNSDISWDGKFCDKKESNKSPNTPGCSIDFTEEHHVSDDEEKPCFDLETRIAMLLQNKETNIAAPFLSLTEGDETSKAGSSESEKSSSRSSDSDTIQESGDDRLDVIPSPLSTPPSPFISAEVYLSCYQTSKEVQLEAQRKELIENHERLNKLKKKRHKKKHNYSLPCKEDETPVNGLDDDRMSLSSLSTNEDPILHQDISVAANFSAPPPGYQQSYSNSESFPSYIPTGYPQQQTANYWETNQGYGVVNNGNGFSYVGNYMSCTTAYPPPPPTGSSYLPVGTAHMGVPPPGHAMYPNWQAYPAPPEQSSMGHQTGHIHDPTVNSCMDAVMEGLKTILKRDLNRRMVEGTAFKTYEAWWDKHEREVEASNETKSSNELSSKSEKVNLVSTLFEKKDGFGVDSLTNFSLGFRAAMPKMPSFKKIRKIKAPTPCLDEDSKGILSDEDSKLSSVAPAGGDISSGSDSQEEIDNKVSNKPTSSKKLTWTSDESEEESEASSDTSDDESEDSSSFESVSSASHIEDHSQDAISYVDDEIYIQKEKELEEFASSILMDAIKTPERNCRASTPLPDTAIDDEWMDVDSMNVKTVTSPKPMQKAVEKTVNPEQPIHRKPITATKVLHRLENETDTADEKEENNMDQSFDSVISPIDGRKSPVLTEHSYCLPWAPKDKSAVQYIPKDHPKKSKLSRSSDHDYTRPSTPPKDKSRPIKKPIGKENQIIKSVHKNLKQGLPLQSEPKLMTKFKARDSLEEYKTLYSFLIKGIDQEDIDFLKRSYEIMIDDVQGMWLNNTLWVFHPPTDVPSPPKKKRKSDELPVHKTGCARTEGIYKVDSKQKQKHKFTFHEEVDAQVEEPQQSLAVLESSKAKPTQISVSREVRSIQRRLLTAYELDSDLLKFNQLKFRKKLLKFGKSRIHDWGLFALETIAADEMVIEYVGQEIRPIIADVREIQYEKMGIGSSYLFRINSENIIDATKGGNLARFINHSCSPNCNARIVTVENRKKVVIYSKNPIACGEEITYDYKFPIEDNKIVCLCGAVQCKGTLN